MFGALKRTAAIALGFSAAPEASATQPQDAIVDTSADEAMSGGFIDEALDAINPLPTLKAAADLVSDTIQGNNNQYIKDAAQSVVDAHYNLGEQMVAAINPLPTLKSAWEMANNAVPGYIKDAAVDIATAPYTLGQSALGAAWDTAQDMVFGAAPATDKPDAATPAPASKNDLTL